MPVDEKDEEWLNLCKLASKESDPRQLRALIAEITRLLTAKERRLKGDNSSARGGTDSTSE
jgi:hypothetical protein